MTLENNKSSFICCQHMQQREFIVDCIHSQLLLGYLSAAIESL